MTEGKVCNVECPYCNKTLTIMKNEKGYSALSRFEIILKFFNTLSVEEKNTLQFYTRKARIPMDDFIEEVMIEFNSEFLSSHTVYNTPEKRLTYACKVVRTRHRD